MKLKRENVKAKIKGDVGIYDIWQIDWLERRVFVNRACGFEWVSMDRVTLEVENK